MSFMIGSTSQTHLDSAFFPILTLQLSMDNMSNLISLAKIYFWLSYPEACSVGHNHTLWFTQRLADVDIIYSHKGKEIFYLLDCFIEGLLTEK